MDARIAFGLFGLFHTMLIASYLPLSDPSLSTLSLLAVSAALVYDNLIIAVGHALSNDLLLALSKPRFFLHLLLTPQLAGAALAHFNFGLTAWICSWAMVGLGFGIEHSAHANLVIVEYRGTVRYTQRPIVPPIPAILTTVIMLALGAYYREWNLFLGSFAMFLLAAAPPSKVGPIPGQFGEVLILWGTWATIASG